MDELKFFVGLTAVTLFVISLFIFVGRKLSKAAERHASDIELPLYITPTGAALFACIAAFWVCCVATRTLAPASKFGEFLNTLDGVASVAAGSIIFIAITSAVLGKFGYPIAKRDRDS